MTSLSPDSTSARPPLRNILVVRQHDQLGDMLCAVPLLRALRQMYPPAHIALVARPLNYEIMLNHPYLDEVLNFDKQRLFTPGDGIGSFARQLRSRRYDLAVVPATVSVSSTSNLIARFSGAAMRIGPRHLEGKKNPTAWCFTHGADLSWTNDPHRHQALRNLDILTPLGITTEDLSHAIGFTAGEKNDARKRLAPLRAKFRRIIGFHPGAGKPPNRWNAKHFAALADYAAGNLDAGIVVTEGPMDREPVSEMLSHLTSPHLLLENLPIRALAAVLDQLDLYVTNDTGVMHIAGGTSTRLLSLFGPTDPMQWAPIGHKNRYVRGKEDDINTLTLEEVTRALDIIMMEMTKEI